MSNINDRSLRKSNTSCAQQPGSSWLFCRAGGSDPGTGTRGNSTSVALCMLILDLLIKLYLEVRALFILHALFYDKGEGNGIYIMVKGTKRVQPGK